MRVPDELEGRSFSPVHDKSARFSKPQKKDLNCFALHKIRFSGREDALYTRNGFYSMSSLCAPIEVGALYLVLVFFATPIRSSQSRKMLFPHSKAVKPTQLFHTKLDELAHIHS